MAQTGPTPGSPTPPDPRRPLSATVLVDRARDGDPAAFEMLAAARVPGAWRVARAILPTDDEATDAVHTTLLAAWRELPRLDDPARFDDWLDRILLAECRMRLAGDGGRAVAAPLPPDLVDRALAAVREAPPRPPGAGASRRRPVAGSWVPGVLLALLSVLVVAAVVTIGVPWLRERVVGPSSTPVAGASATPPATTPTATPAGTRAPDATGVPAVAPDALDVGVIAMVTLDGSNLRVRTTPGTSAAWLKPLLPAGTRMLLVGGPVTVDGYTWYEVQTDGELIDLFGWVAAGDNDVPWIAPTAPRCFGGLDAAAAVNLARIDFLVCHRDAEVRLQARDLRGEPGPEGDCGWVRSGNGCDVDHPWLLLPSSTVAVPLPDGQTRDLAVAMPPELAEAIRDLPPDSTLALTVSLDSPEAAGCGIRDAATGKDLVPRDRAVMSCRLQFVVQEVAFRQ